MKYPVQRNIKYDFIGQSYSKRYPNLHRYPATMIPQIGIEILNELRISKGSLLDPYCGSGSTFASALESGIKYMEGYDINPLAILISSAKFTYVSILKLLDYKKQLRNDIYDFLKVEENIDNLVTPNITNIEFWFSKDVIDKLKILKYFITSIDDSNVKNFFLVAFSETVRDCSFTRNSEFKLYKMKSEEILNFNPDVISIFFHKLSVSIEIYFNHYFPYLNESLNININNSEFSYSDKRYDVVLTSPPYGDSRTTVAYGQFSTLANEWIDVDYARKIDSMLMGGKKALTNYNNGVIAESIREINNNDTKRALEVSSFYFDLEQSINQVSSAVINGGYAIYVVGNRTVKGVQLQTDQFIAEKFEENGFRHILTYERALSNKAMPSKNSPTNKSGITKNTMLFEYIVVCQKD